jgi:aminopeptidase N
MRNFLLLLIVALMYTHVQNFVRSLARRNSLRNVRGFVSGGSRTLSAAFIAPVARSSSRGAFALAAFAGMSAAHSTEAGSGTDSQATCHGAAEDGAAAGDSVLAKEVFRADYAPSLYKVPEIYMDFQLGTSKTVLTTTSLVHPVAHSMTDLVLDGEDNISLKSLKINGVPVAKEDYKIEEESLRIFARALPPVAFKLETVVELEPDKNLQLAGLYASGSSLLCTQCEALGFRRITYSLDRPDILSKYLVRLEADQAAFPQLLSNGNKVQEGTLPGGRHFAVWDDPFLKPSYLFAVVAGNLGSIHDTYTTTSGRVVKLGIYCDKEDAGKLDHAMYSIKAAMKWDEDTFGLECDLDVYNIVATADFNMGAMENKGLNVFNSAYVLANPATATDTDFENILGVIGHEYFHNWTGNRVTVRDWFQLTLKEGLTVQRDQWFSSDMSGLAVKRIADVRALRSRQFAEDAGPMAHPIRPESYVSMDNFYTATVYSKGAEVIRMYRTLLGDDGFKKGMKLYFARHDGAAVTCDDFRAAMADANGVDLTQFERWYSQAGTPVVSVQQAYDPAAKTLTVTLRQRCPTTPGQPAEKKLPFVIPVVVGLLSEASGKEILPSKVLTFASETETFVFENISEKPVLSFLRGFSAPVTVEMTQSDAELAFLMANDTDTFNRWDASNRLSTKVIMSLLGKASVSDIEQAEVPAAYVEAIRKCLRDSASSDAALLSLSLQLPDLTTLSTMLEEVDVDKLVAARKRVKEVVARALQAEFLRVYEATVAKGPYAFNAAETGRRRLHNVCLDYLSVDSSPEAAKRAKQQFDSSDCMTDNLMALAALTAQAGPCPERDAALAQFYSAAAGDALVINKWFSIQASMETPDVVQRVQALRAHKDFTLSNPNRFRSLVSFFAANLPAFHVQGGAGYKFVADAIIEVDALNPQVAARLAQAFSQWRRFDATRRAQMKAELERVLAVKALSKDTKEVVARCLKA